MRVARLSADLVANSTSFESSLKRANSAMAASKNQWTSALNTANRSFTSFDSHVRRSMGSIVDLKTQIGGLATIVATSLSAQRIIQYSDTWRQLEGRLRIVTENADELALAQDKLFKIAQKTRQPLEAVANLYVRMNNVLDENQKKQYDLAGITETINLALAVTGEGAAQASSAILQFSQAVQSDFKSSAQEINSLLDSAPRLALAIQRSFGDGTKSLKKLAEDGELSTDRVLRALEPLANQGRLIREEFGQMQLTVGQALTQLDNAFLRFIGQNDLAAAGTSSLAAAISTLADNFGVLATTVGAVAVVFATRFTVALGTAGVAAVRSFTASTAAATAYSAALDKLSASQAMSARMAYGMAAAQKAAAGSMAAGVVVVNSAGAAVVATTTAMGLAARTTAVAMAGLAGAARLAGGAVAFLGGPVGVAIITALAVMTLRTDEAAEAQQRMNERLGEHRDMVNEFIGASKERRKEILDATNENIKNLMREYEAINALYAAYNQKNFAGRRWQNLKGRLGIGMGKEEIVAQGAALENALNQLNKDKAALEQLNKTLPPPGASPSGGTGKKKDVYKDILADLKEESEQLEIQTQMYGAKETAIEKAQRAAKIQNQINAAGLKLSQQQQEAITEYLAKIEEQTELQKKQAEQQEQLEKLERDREEAINQLGASFESAFENAITSGEKLSDVLQGLLDDILKILTRVTITEPLGNAVAQWAKGSAGGGGFLDSLFSWLPSFDVGTDYVPYDMVAKIHKGERILTADENAAMMAGGGQQVNVIINNNNGSQVTQKTQQNGNGTDLIVTIDQMVSQNINNPSSRTAQALKAQQNRTLVRR